METNRREASAATFRRGSRLRQVSLSLSEPRPLSPTAEAADLKSAQCRFESDRGYVHFNRKDTMFNEYQWQFAWFFLSGPFLLLLIVYPLALVYQSFRQNVRGPRLDYAAERADNVEDANGS